jgi:DNA-binding response OmpR family regulator
MKQSILLVDDEVLVRKAVGDLLRLEGYQVVTAEDGEAGIRLSKEQQFDLVVLDLKLPGIGGLEALEAIKKATPQSKVIILTGHGSVETAIEAIHYKVDDYVLKQPATEELLASVRKALVEPPLLSSSPLPASSTPESAAGQPEAPKGSDETTGHRLRNEQVRREKLAQLGEPAEHAEIYESAEGIRIDLSRRIIQQEEKVQKLTPAEARLLQVFLEESQQVISSQELVRRAQGYETKEWEAPDVIRPHVSRLRSKLGIFPGGGDWIINIRGNGYLFDGVFAAKIHPESKKQPGSD